MYRFWQQRFLALAAGAGTAIILWKVFGASDWVSVGLGILACLAGLRFVGGLAPDPSIMPLYAPGTPIIAVKPFHSISDGTPGIILELKPYRHWARWRLAYECLFAGNVRASARPQEIERRDHRYTLYDLERANFAEVPEMRGHVGKATV